MNVEQFDLNLLRVFDAVYEDRNLLSAGRRLHLSQSAVSHALARMRESLDDELFVRTRKGMEPTARALVIAPVVRQSLARIREALGAPLFEPDRSARRFVIAANDYATAVIVARLSHDVEAAAPKIDLVVRPATRLDLAEQIDGGRIDLAIGVFAEVPTRFRSAVIGEQDDVVVMRAGHPLGGASPSVEDFDAYPLLTVSLGGNEEGAIGGFIAERGLARQSEMFNRQALEAALGARGIVPRYRMTTAHALAIPMLLRDSDMLSIVPRPLAAEFARGGMVVTAELPYPTPRVRTLAVWHERNDDDVGHRWLREHVKQAAGSIEAFRPNAS